MKTIKMLMVMAIIMFIATMAGAENTIKGKVGDTAWKSEIESAMAKQPTKLTDAEVKNANIGQSLKVGVEKSANGFTMMLTGIRLVPKADPTKPSMEAAALQLSSGVKEVIQGKDQRWWINMTVKGGTTKVSVPNHAQTKGMAVVEKHDGIGRSTTGEPGYLMLDPNDPFVIYEKDASSSYVAANGDHVDLQTLCIAYVMYPDGTARPLKQVLKERGETYTNGYLAGPHSEMTK